MRSRTELKALFPKWTPLTAALLLAACGTTPRVGTISNPPSSRGPVSSAPISSQPVPRGPVSDTPVKIGKPYQVGGIWYYPADTADYDEVGYASWYGDAFHGGPTANGEVYDMNMVGAAHKTLPLPCYVEVTALDTGRTVLLRVNDRGPFVTNRIIDLSRRAAEELGIARQGVARVRVKRVYPNDADKLALRSGRAAKERPVAASTALASLDNRFQRWLAEQSRPVTPVAASTEPPAPAPLFSASAIGGYFVQVGAYGDLTRATGLAQQLGGSVDSAGSVYRVRIGPYFDENVALAALARAQGQGYQDARLIRPTAIN
jgi:rare lipoprotein A